MGKASISLKMMRIEKWSPGNIRSQVINFTVKEWSQGTESRDQKKVVLFVKLELRLRLAQA